MSRKRIYETPSAREYAAKLDAGWHPSEDLIKRLQSQLTKDYVYHRERKRLEALEAAAVERGELTPDRKRIVRMKAQVSESGDLIPVQPEKPSA